MPPKKSTRSKPKRTMSAEHKAAIAEGRTQARAVSKYLNALEANKRKPGRQRTPDSIRARLAKIDDELAGADAITALSLRQERRDLKRELTAKQAPADIGGLESDFVEHAAAYGARKGISYGVWREAGVPTKVLSRAGITRSS